MDNPQNTPIKRRGRPKKAQTVFDNNSQAQAHTGISAEHFKTAKKMGAPGMEHNRIDWVVFAPWYEKNKAQIESGLITNKDVLQSYKRIRDIIDYDLSIQKKRNEAISPEDMYSFLSRIGTAQCSLAKSWKRDYPSKLAGKSESDCSIILEQAINDLLNLYQKEMEKWMPQSQTKV